MTPMQRVVIGPSVRCFVALCSTFLWLVFSSASSLVQAGEPTEKIRVAVDQGVQILKESQLDMNNGRKEAIGRLRQIVYPLFDFTEMAKRSLGAHWRTLTAEEKLEFVKVFTELLEISYAERIDLYNGQKVVFTREEVDDDYATVNSKIVNSKGEQFSVGYKLLRRDGADWRIYDVVVENISLVNNYRSQFHRVIANSSYRDLIKKMKDKTG